MPGHVPSLLKLFIVAALTSSGAVTSLAQTSAEEFRSALRSQTGFTADEFSALERGEVVVKLLPSTDKREVAFCGVLRLQGTPETLLTAFKENLTRQNSRVILGGRKLSTPPVIEDLQGLTLEKRDVEEMKRCAVGNCGLQMSAEMIERLQREVDWSAPDYRTRATQLYRQMLFDYVQDYLAQGDAALIEYGDGANAVRSVEEQRALLNSLPYVKDSAPEFADYLQSPHRLGLPGVENALHWSKLQFGLKPVIVITHTATYARQYDNAPQIVVATKQLYANHYIDASMSLTLLMNVSTGGAASDTYLLYANRARSGTLGGLFGGLKRRIIEKEVSDGLRTILGQTKLTVETRSANQSGPASRADDEVAGTLPWTQRLFGKARYFFLAFLAAASLLLIWLRRRELKTRNT